MPLVISPCTHRRDDELLMHFDYQGAVVTGWHHQQLMPFIGFLIPFYKIRLESIYCLLAVWCCTLFRHSTRPCRMSAVAYLASYFSLMKELPLSLVAGILKRFLNIEIEFIQTVWQHNMEVDIYVIVFIFFFPFPFPSFRVGRLVLWILQVSLWLYEPPSTPSFLFRVPDRVLTSIPWWIPTNLQHLLCWHLPLDLWLMSYESILFLAIVFVVHCGSFIYIFLLQAIMYILCFPHEIVGGCATVQITAFQYANRTNPET